MVTYQDGILLFGGIHDIAHEKNDILYFNCPEERWTRIEEDSTRRPEILSSSTRHALPKKTTLISREEIPQIIQPSKFLMGSLTSRDPMIYKKTVHRANYLNKKTIKDKKRSISPRRSKFFSQSVTSALAPKSPGALKEERIKKEQNMKKMMLLSEFEVSEDLKTQLVMHSPTTEAMRSSINTIKVESKPDFTKTK